MSIRKTRRFQRCTAHNVYRPFLCKEACIMMFDAIYVLVVELGGTHEKDDGTFFQVNN